MFGQVVNGRHHLRIILLQVVIQTKVKKEQVLQIEGVIALGGVVPLRMLQKLSQLVLPADPPHGRNHSVIIMKGRLKEIRRVTEDGDVGGVRRQQLGNLPTVKAHVVADDVEALPRPVVLHLRALEGRRVEEVVVPVREGKPELVLLPEPEEDVEDGAAGSFVGLKKHYVDLWGAHFLPRLGRLGPIWL